MSVAKFSVTGEHRAFNGSDSATVLIDREHGLITVRPFRQHRSYTLPLASVAENIVAKVILSEAAESKPKRRFLAKRNLL